MKAQQISIFLENRAGRLGAVTGLLDEQGINIRALSLADTSDFGILRLIVDKPDQAQIVLKENNFTFSMTEVVAVEVPDRPGGLAGVLRMLDDAKINLEYMYAFFEKTSDQAVLIFRFDNIDAAIAVLLKKGIHILKSEELFNM